MSKIKILILASIFIAIIIIILIVFFKNETKIFKNGNNMSSQEIVDYFLNISSYKATITVEVHSNKNFNKYIIKQEYINSKYSMQEVVEPSNIQGVKITKDDSGLKIENTNLNLSTIFENYEYIADNCLDLSSFIHNYTSNNKSNYKEENGQIIMTTQNINDNKYTKHQTLYIDKNTKKPTKLEIKDYNQNTTINIIYNEVEINSL